MPKKPPHTSLSCSPDCPWVTIRGDTGSLNVNFREVMRGEMFAASPDRKRLIAEWIRARDADGAVGKVAAPDVPPGTRIGPRMKAKR